MRGRARAARALGFGRVLGPAEGGKASTDPAEAWLIVAGVAEAIKALFS
jgi:hypothetical protein